MPSSLGTVHYAGELRNPGHDGNGQQRNDDNAYVGLRERIKTCHDVPPVRENLFEGGQKKKNTYKIWASPFSVK